MKRGFFSLFFIGLAFSPQLFGEIYLDDMEESNFTLISVECKNFSTRIVVKGTNFYNITLPEGVYNISFFTGDRRYKFSTTLFLHTNTRYDVILFEENSEEIEFEDFPLEEKKGNDLTVILPFLAIIVVFSLFYFYKKRKKEEIPLTEEEKKVLEYLSLRGGIAEQKEIKKFLNVSDARISVLLSTLEAERKIKKIKKGRKNYVKIVERRDFQE